MLSKKRTIESFVAKNVGKPIFMCNFVAKAGVFMKSDSANDPMGTAIMDYHLHKEASRLRVLSSMFDDDEMPVPYLFRQEKDMPEMERRALQTARGRVLDIGAGAGCHSLALQSRGMEVTAVELSPLSCQVMKERGVKNVVCGDVLDVDFGQRFDTILLLMNGIGIAGKMARLPKFLGRMKELLADGGQIITDSSDLKYIYENDDGSFDINLNGNYYGEVDFQMAYNSIKGKSFDWLYIDFPLLKSIAGGEGLQCEKLMDGEHYDYLARMEKVKGKR